jgi:LPXTG-motif cell wall-anchored protein
MKADYFLRAVQLEKGDKEIVMEFNPQSVKTGNTLTFVFNVIFILLVLGGGFYWWKNRKGKTI